jgi:hypothetical protein
VPTLKTDPVPWLLKNGEPWVRYRTLLDLVDCPEDDPDVIKAREAMLAHPLVQELVEKAAGWPGYPLGRHNDAKHPLHALATLADFGLRAEDPGVGRAVAAVMSHQAPERSFQTLMVIPKAFGGTDEESWSWIICDAPTLLYSLLGMGLADRPEVQSAVDHLNSLVDDVGWPCVCSHDLGRFRGPGRKSDPCPFATLISIKALAQVPEHQETDAARKGVEMLLGHWEHQGKRKMYLFGIGTDFRKPKYPFIWYDILHVTDVVSRLPFARGDPRFRDMVGELLRQADEDGRVTPRSMYRAWKGWQFADKKAPSPWLTFLTARVARRVFGRSSPG